MENNHNASDDEDPRDPFALTLPGNKVADPEKVKRKRGPAQTKRRAK